MIASAVQAAGWPLVGDIRYTDMHPSGWYPYGSSVIGFFLSKTSYVNEAVLDEEGNQVVDEEGNNVYQQRKASVTDYSPLFCMGAQWRASTRWVQSVTEAYTMSVSAPQSISQFGTITTESTYSLDESADTETWEDYTANDGGAQANTQYYVDQDTDRASVNNAMSVALNQARTTILGSHRDTRVTVRMPIRPDIDLKHTIQVTTDEITCKGKVFEIEHSFNSDGLAETTLTLVLSRAQGSSSDSSLAVPSKISDNVSDLISGVSLGNHYGIDPESTNGSVNWTGYIGNASFITNGAYFETNYPESFVVDTPPIPESLRSSKELTSTDSYTVEVPNDTLTITFDGKS